MDQYFSDFGAPTKKSKHDEMVHLGISNIGYNAFLKRKGQGEPPSVLCFGLRNVSWLREIARASANEDEFENLFAAYKDAERQTQAAYGKIVRRKMPK